MKCPVEYCHYSGYYWTSHFKEIHNMDLALSTLVRILEGFEGRLNKIEDEIKELTTYGNNIPQVNTQNTTKVLKLREQYDILTCIIFKGD